MRGDSETGAKTGAKSVAALYSGFLYSDWLKACVPVLPMRKICPSGSALATLALPTMPAAAPMFSEMMVCPSRSPSACAWMRALASTPPPGAKGMMRVIGRVGQFCASAGPARASPASETETRALSMGVLRSNA